MNLLRPRALVLTVTMEVTEIPGVMGSHGGTRLLGGPGVSRLPRDLLIPGIVEVWNFNWLCKHIKWWEALKIFLTNSRTELTFSLWVLVKAEFILRRNYRAHKKICTNSATSSLRENSAFKVYTLSRTYKINIVLLHMDYYHSLMLLSRKLLCKYTK